MKFFRVSLIKSLIGTPKSTRLIAKSLGLTRMHRVRYIPATLDTAGSVLKLRALVSSSVHSFSSIKDMKAHVMAEKNERKPADGFTVRINQ